MNEKELLESIKRDSHKNEKKIKEFCAFHNITLQEFRERLDRAIAARKRKYPPDYPKAIITPHNPNKNK